MIAPKGLLCGKRSKNPCPSVRVCVSAKNGRFIEANEHAWHDFYVHILVAEEKARFWDLQFFHGWFEILTKLFKTFFKNKLLPFIYPSQKSRLTHFVTKRVLVYTDKTLIILYFWPFWRLSDPSDVGLTYPIWTQLQTFERFPHKSPFGATLAPRV